MCIRDSPYYAGDAIVMMDENPDLGFVIPKEGTNYFVDAMCIPKGAKNKEAAEMFINYMCEVDVGAANCDFIGYSTPIDAVRGELPEELANSPIAVSYTHLGGASEKAALPACGT